ncbi:MAG: outer membrane receptor protein involved in Fe transport [Cyclobacteriaceae bacterium]
MRRYLLQIKVTSTSFFEHDQLLAGSSVSVIERADRVRTGAPSVMLMPSLDGRRVVAIRGYAQLASSRGIATLADGIPMNEPLLGAGQHTAQNINLGVLDRIEVIRGPGSALYGSDAFHGVISMSTFESEEDYELFPTFLVNAGVGHTIERLGLEIYLNNQYFYGAQDIEYSATLLGTPEDLPAYWRADLNLTKHVTSDMNVFLNIINLFDRDNRVHSAERNGPVWQGQRRRW